MILIVVVVFMTLLSIFLILGINFNPPQNKIIQKEVIVESFVHNNNDDKKSFSFSFS